MIESKGRKAAFLCEAVRALGLQRVHVQSERFEDVVDRTRPHTIDLISVRAVKSDNALRERIHLVVGRQGQVFLFHSPTAPVQSHPWFEKVEVVPLRTNGDAKLTILKPLFHVEHNE
jgi:16S rRNA G527 N7-methylase RsmG